MNLATLRQASLLVAMVVSALVTGCGDIVHDVTWQELSLHLLPGAYSLVRGDSLFIGFQFYVRDSYGDVPGSVKEISILDPTGFVYQIGLEDYSYFIFCGTGCDTGRVYRRVELADTVPSGLYLWQARDTDNNIAYAADTVFAAPLRLGFDDGSLFPPDSSVVVTKVPFGWPAVGPGFAYYVVIHDASGFPVYRQYTGRNEYTHDGAFLEKNAWYWWRLEVWDITESNCWESSGKRWFYTGG
jgi:hypothetical protein